MNVVKNLYLNGGIIGNTVTGVGYLHAGDATNVPMIKVLGAAGNVATNAIQFDNANADYTFNGANDAVTATVWPATATLARNVVVNMAAAGNTLTMLSRTINGNLTLTQGVLLWDSPVDVVLASGSIVTRTNNSSINLNSDASADGVIGTLTAPLVNLIYKGAIGNTGVEYSSPTVVNNLTLGTSALATVTLNSARSIDGTITFYTGSVLTISKNTTFTLGQTLGGTINVTPTFLLTLGGVSTLGTVTGDVTTVNNLTLNGNHSAGTITSSANITVGTNGSFAASSNLSLNGATDVTLTVPAAGAVLGTLTLTKDGSQNTVTLTGGNLTTTLINFTKGLFVTTGSLYVQIAQGAVGTPAQGFVRNVATGDMSHVVGLVRTTLKAGIIEAFGRNEFPVGSLLAYCPVAITTLNPGANVTLGVNIIAGYNATAPTGITGLPIVNGVAVGSDIARYAQFYWSLKSDVNLGNTKFDLELTSPGFADFDDLNNVRIIRRMGIITDTGNPWTLQGSQYNNFMSVGVPTVTNVQTFQGLSTASAIFTFGMKSRLTVATPFSPVTIGYVGGAYYSQVVSLANHFTGPTGTTLTYSASSSNTAIANVLVVNNTLTISGVTNGTCEVTVRATDQNNDFITTLINVTVNSAVGTEKEVIPTEYAISQNYPNPFNPTTAIRYALPNESQVTIKVYNMLAQEVATLVNEVKAAGYHTINFNANGLASGRYIAVIKAGEFSKTIKMNLLK